jgi:hypothetical protein
MHFLLAKSYLALAEEGLALQLRFSFEMSAPRLSLVNASPE